MLELDNLIDKILDIVPSSSSLYNESVTATKSVAKISSATDCSQQPQQYEQTVNDSHQCQADVRQSQAHSTQPDDNNHSTAKLYGNTVASLSQINNNATVSKQTKGVRNALMSEMVDFSSLNSIISSQQDNATG